MIQPTTLKIEEHGSRLKIIRIHGDLDTVGVRMVEEAFTKATGERSEKAVVDLTEVSFISSAGLAMLLVKGKILRRGGGSLAIAGATRRVQEVLTMAGFNELFDLYPTPADALAALERA
jgi:anti-anti-sigma factor